MALEKKNFDIDSLDLLRQDYCFKTKSLKHVKHMLFLIYKTTNKIKCQNENRKEPNEK